MFFYDQSGYARSYAPAYAAIGRQRPAPTVPVNIDGPCAPEGDVTRSFVKQKVDIILPADVELNPTGAVYAEIWKRAAARLGTTFEAVRAYVQGTISAVQARGYTGDEGAAYANFCTAELARGVPVERLPSARSVIERARITSMTPPRAGTGQAFGGRDFRSARFAQPEAKAVIPEAVTVMKPNGFTDEDVRTAVTKKLFEIGAAKINQTVPSLGQWIQTVAKNTSDLGYSTDDVKGYVNYCLGEIVHGRSDNFRQPGEIVPRQRQIAAEYARANPG